MSTSTPSRYPPALRRLSLPLPGQDQEFMRRHQVLLFPLLILLLLGAPGAALFLTRIVVRPFGYVAMEHVFDSAAFNAPPSVLSSLYRMSNTVSLPPNPWSTSLAEMPLRERLRAVLALARHIQELSSPTGRPRSGTEIFERGSQYLFICSEHAKVFTALLRSAGTPARVIWMCGHTTAEVYDRSTGWVLADPYGNLMLRLRGRYLSTVDAVQSDELSSVVPERIAPELAATDFHFPSREWQPLYKRQPCIVELAPDDVYEFHARRFDITSLTAALLTGSGAIARGLQFVPVHGYKLGLPYGRRSQSDRAAEQKDPLTTFSFGEEVFGHALP